MEELYINNELDKNRDIKILQISNYSYFSHMQKLIRRYSNCSVQMYVDTLDLETKKTLLLDFDLIIFYTHDHYNTHELEYLEHLAHYLSNKLNKRITIGYTYNPLNGHILNESLKDEIEIISYTQNEITNEIIDLDSIISITELLNITLRNHDNYSLHKRKFLR